MTECNRCGSDDWTLFHETERGPHERRVRKFSCDGCGAEGRRFDRGRTGVEIESGAMR